MISLERNFNTAKVNDYIQKKMDERANDIVIFLRNKGMEYTKLARNKTLAREPYNNITWNLVSSVGFGIAKYGIISESYFPVLRTGSEGAAKGERLAEKAAKELCGPNEIALVLVAGENYASFVQSKGKDVISASSNAFEAYLGQLWGGNR